MKRAKKIFWLVLITLSLLYSALYLFLVFNGNRIFTKQLERILKKRVSIGHLSLTPPNNIYIRNLDIEGFGKADFISITPSILGFLTGKIAFNNISIIKPEVTIIREAPKTALQAPAAPNSTSKAQPAPQEKPIVRLIFKELTIKNGKVHLIDETIGKDGLEIMAKDLYFKLNNLYMLPRSVVTTFELKCKIPWQKASEVGKVEAEGWLNFYKKSMEAALKIEDIDAIYLYPYYSNWVDLEKARIEKAKLRLTSNIHGLDNNITAQTLLELTDIVRRPLEAGEGEEKASKITDAVLDMFRAQDGGKIALNFSVKTKMDNPEFGFGDIKMAFEDKLAQGKKGTGLTAERVLVLPKNLVEGAFKGLTDLTTSVIVGGINAANEIKKSVEDTFAKEKKPEQTKTEERGK